MRKIIIFEIAKLSKIDKNAILAMNTNCSKSIKCFWSQDPIQAGLRYYLRLLLNLCKFQTEIQTILLFALFSVIFLLVSAKIL